MTARRVELGDYTEEQLRVQRAGEALHRDGASPAGALELLAALVEDQTWERLTDAKGRSFKGRFRDFVETRSPFGLGYDPDQLPKVLALRHPHESVPDVAYRMATMRKEVQTLLVAEISAAFPLGGDRRSDGFQNSGTDSKPNRETAEHIISRLKRPTEQGGDPDLAERVVRGEITPNAAAREKGWRKPRILLSTPENIAESLRRYLPREALSRLIELLIQPEGDTGRPEGRDHAGTEVHEG